MKALNGCGGQEDLMIEAMHMESCAAPSTGGNGALSFGSNGCTGPLEADMGLEAETVAMDGSLSAAPPKELEIITVASMHIPCRVTNSYAYL